MALRQLEVKGGCQGARRRMALDVARNPRRSLRLFERRRFHQAKAFAGKVGRGRFRCSHANRRNGCRCRSRKIQAVPTVEGTRRFLVDGNTCRPLRRQGGLEAVRAIPDACIRAVVALDPPIFICPLPQAVCPGSHRRRETDGDELLAGCRTVLRDPFKQAGLRPGFPHAPRGGNHSKGGLANADNVQRVFEYDSSADD